ncbi:hypothetical protein [Tritonibacter mobilis]|uniref:Uncharacterized protein n=1 Tax=Tritonibacter mobilis F1926 TaxID=1265309 RepID=A0A1B1A6J5_9RHOB|nr:hypothetical protein [Tritonibacter mobilis]ANP42193.1 hypothetical protein K529_015545 [Tritonibacter mobilis F1926]KJZ22295.1 hypothetical protein TW79_18885 [Tritonibacter mobilis]
MRYPLFKHFCSYLLNTPMGLAIGIIFTCVLGVVFDDDFFVGFTKHYTFVVSASLSLVVASFAVAGVFSNIASQREKDEDSRKRKLLAARARLPLALAEMSKACTEGVRLTVEYPSIQSDLTKPHSLLDKSAVKLRLSEETYRTLEQVIEFHDNVDVAQRVVRFLQLYQSSTQRLLAQFEPRKLIQYWGEGNPMRVRAVEWALVQAIVISLFRYSREGILPPVTPDTVRTALQLDQQTSLKIGNIDDYQKDIQAVHRRYLEQDNAFNRT